MKTHVVRTLVTVSLVAASTVLHAENADPFADVEMKAQHLSKSVYMLEGAGGNIGVSIGPDGTLIIDDQFAPLADKIIAAVEELGGDRPKLVLNTHFHFDHTGSNPTMGAGGTIISHDNVRTRLLDVEGMTRTGLPLVTFDEDLKVHFNDDELQLVHLPAGHTDGDAVVWFKSANVIHMGDLFFKRRYPFVDVSSGGTIAGFIGNVEQVIGMIPDDIIIIPGHGTVSNKQDLVETIATVKASVALVRNSLAKGESADEIAAELDLAYPDEGVGFISAARWIEIIQADAAR